MGTTFSSELCPTITYRFLSGFTIDDNFAERIITALDGSTVLLRHLKLCRVNFAASEKNLLLDVVLGLKPTQKYVSALWNPC